MNEKPILFSGPMIRAILDGTKTQTRRIAHITDPVNYPGMLDAKCVNLNGKTYWWNCQPEHQNHILKVCPHGQSGDRLWVRETWQHSNFPFGPLEKSCDIFYRADYFDDPLGVDLEKSEDGIKRKWKPSIHIPRWASRINLEITGIRIERLQDINEDEAIAEGIKLIDHNCFENYLVNKDWIYQARNRKGTHAVEDSIMSYASLWESINGAGSWDANP